MAGFIALLCVSVSLCENMFSFAVFFTLDIGYSVLDIGYSNYLTAKNGHFLAIPAAYEKI